MCDVVRRIGGRNSHPGFHRVLAIARLLHGTTRSGKGVVGISKNYRSASFGTGRKVLQAMSALIARRSAQP